MDRRSFFERMGTGICGAALLSLLERDALAGVPSGAGGHASAAAPEDLRPRRPHFAPRAKSVIHLYMNGGPSQMDLFDPKAELDRNHGKPYFNKIAGEVENPQAAGALMRAARSSLPSTARAARGFPRRCRTWRRWSTTWPSCGGCTPPT